MGLKNILSRVRAAQQKQIARRNTREANTLRKLRLQRIAEEARATRQKAMAKERERINKARGPGIAEQLGAIFGETSKPRTTTRKYKKRKTRKTTRKAYAPPQVIVLPPTTAPRKRRRSKPKKKAYDPFGGFI